METLKLDPETKKLFKDCKVVPGNGYSPHTGFTVFRAIWTIYGDYGKSVIVKMGKRPLNNHKSIMEEWEIIKDLEHTSIIKVHQSYHIRPNNECIVMEDLPYGGRRTRWREIIMKWNSKQIGLFIQQMFNIITWLNDRGIEHSDIEFANIGARDENYAPVLFDFGRSQKINPNRNLLRTNLLLEVKTGYNAWSRELMGIDGKYKEEGPMSHHTYNTHYIGSYINDHYIPKIYEDLLKKL